MYELGSSYSINSDFKKLNSVKVWILIIAGTSMAGKQKC